MCNDHMITIIFIWLSKKNGAQKKNPKPYNFLGPETDRKNACEGGDLFLLRSSLLAAAAMT